MVLYILSLIKGIFEDKSYMGNLEAYIAANNPQTADDIDRLEREFTRRQTATFFHE